MRFQLDLTKVELAKVIATDGAQCLLRGTSDIMKLGSHMSAINTTSPT